MDDVTQFLIEESLYERIDAVEMRMKAATAAVSFDDQGSGGLSPGEIQASSHAARMANLVGQG